MVKKGLLMFVFLLTAGTSLVSCAPSGEAGIEVPVVVNRVDMLISEVDMLDTLFGELTVKPGGVIEAATITPVNPYDTFLFVEVSTSYSGGQNPCSWSGNDAVRLSLDKDGNTATIDLFNCYTDYEEGYIRFYFPAYRTGGSNVRLLLGKDKSVALDGMMP